MVGVNYPNSTTCTSNGFYYNESTDYCTSNEDNFTEKLKALTKVKQEFDKPDNIGVPFMMMAIPKINKRLSQLRQRHTR